MCFFNKIYKSYKKLQPVTVFHVLLFAFIYIIYVILLKCFVGY